MILVDIYVPAIDQTFDFYLDETVPIESVLDEIGEMILQTTVQDSEEWDNEEEPLLLCSKEQNRILPGNLSLNQCGIKNGSRLFVV